MAKHDLDALAMRHLLRHPNDKSGSYLARMNRRFGRAAADAAIEKAQKVLLLMEVPHTVQSNPARRIKPASLAGILRGRTARLSIIDEYGPINMKALLP